MNDVFHGAWSDKEQMISDFGISEQDLKGCKILFASYNSSNYQGTAFVLYAKRKKLYEVNGSHCSCYGLNNLWLPESTTIEAILARPYLSDYIERYGLSKRLKQLKEDGYK